MLDTEKSDEQNITAQAGQQSVEPRGRLGTLLREAREKKNLSQQDLSEIIRLRRYYIQALEDEAWNLLPAAVFVKGFIKSYARAVELDEKEILYRYSLSAPNHGTAPFPECRRQSPWSPRIIIAGILFLVAGIIILIAFLARSCTSIGGSEKNQPSNPSLTFNTTIEQKILSDMDKQSGNQTNPSQSKENVNQTEVIPESIFAEESNRPFIKRGFIEPPAGMTIKGEWKLKAAAKSETWIMIYKDKELPRDYTFQPGDKREWRGKEGFYLIVGNANGIDFEVNGIPIEQGGGPGEVIKLRFPKDYVERKANEP